MYSVMFIIEPSVMDVFVVFIVLLNINEQLSISESASVALYWNRI